MKNEAIVELTNGYSDYYNIFDSEITVTDTLYQNNNLEIGLFVKLNVMLKAESVMDIPVVKGMLESVNVNSTSIYSDNLVFLETEIKEANLGYITIKQAAKISSLIESKISEIEQYIGEEQELNIYLKLDADLDENNVISGSITIQAECLDGYVPIEYIFPLSEDEMKVQGEKELGYLLENSNSNSKDINEKGSSLRASLSSGINNSIYYMLNYTSNPTTCNIDGCGTLQDSTKWNNSQYHYYSGLHGTDCADYVSQALSAGGLTEDSTWYATKNSTVRSATWVSVSTLSTYMVNRGAWVSIDPSVLAAGSIVIMPAHIVMITGYDGVTYKFSGHTNDRHNAVFYKKSNYIYYNVKF